MRQKWFSDQVKVVHFVSQITGGAGMAAWRLHSSLKKKGFDSNLVTLKEFVMNADGMLALSVKRDLSSRLYRRVRSFFYYRHLDNIKMHRTLGFDLFSPDWTRLGKTICIEDYCADVVNLHWIPGLIDIPSILPLAKVPLVWRIPDEFPITGGCHYSLGCERWKNGCGACPQLGSIRQNDASSRSWERKQKTFKRAGGNLVIVSPSTWLFNRARESLFFGKARVEHIPTGTDLNKYQSRGREGLRRAFGLGERDRALLFVADRVSNRRKGFGVLQEALAGLQVPRGGRLVLFSVGRKAPEGLENHEHIALGSIENEELMAAVYSAADLFVAPSLQDNLPNTVLESLACGTPVIGSHTGGIPDMVRPGDTGWLFETGNGEALRATLREALATRDLTGLRTRCREVAEREYSLELQAERYKKLYEEVAGRA